jgi:hypothetical protein
MWTHCLRRGEEVGFYTRILFSSSVISAPHTTCELGYTVSKLFSPMVYSYMVLVQVRGIRSSARRLTIVLFVIF